MFISGQTWKKLYFGKFDSDMNHIYAFCISFTSCENICVHLAQWIGIVLHGSFYEQ